jgi:hypothetical protein
LESTRLQHPVEQGYGRKVGQTLDINLHQPKRSINICDSFQQKVRGSLLGVNQTPAPRRTGWAGDHRLVRRTGPSNVDTVRVNVRHQSAPAKALDQHLRFVPAEGAGLIRARWMFVCLASCRILTKEPTTRQTLSS